MITKLTYCLASGLLFIMLTGLTDKVEASTEASAKVDSLKKVIETTDIDTTKAKALNLLSVELRYSFPDTAIMLAEQALELYKTQVDKKGMANVHLNLGVLKRLKSDYPSAIKHVQKSLETYQELDDFKGIADCYMVTGLTHWNQSDYPNALEYSFKALKTYQELKEEESIALMYNNIGNIYTQQASYPQALEYYLKCSRYEGVLPNKGANVYNNIGIIYYYQRSYSQALEYFKKALKSREELGNKQGLASSYTNIGGFYMAIYALNDSLALGEVGWARDNPSQLLDTALVFQQKAYKLNNELHNEYEMVITLIGIGSVYMHKDDYSKAIDYYKQTIQLADSIKAMKEASEAHSALAQCYEKLGSHQLALEHYKQYTALKDSTFNEEKSKELGKLEANHEMQMAAAEQKKAEEQQQIFLQDQTERRNLLQYSGILIFIVAFFITLLFSGRLKIPIRMAEGGVFFTFLLVFEFLLVLTDPYIEQYTGGEPAYKLLVNAGLAGLIFPLHSIAETKLKTRLFLGAQRA